MKNLIGKCKSLIACAIAFAVAAVSLFTGVFVTASAETVGTCGRTIVEKWDQYSDGAWSDWYDASFDGKGDGTKDNPYIITSAEELANLCRYGSNAGVYYKVDDNIKAFDMNNSGIDLSSDDVTAEYVKQQLADIICGKVWACDAPFKGNFDGNGVEIYGLRAGPAYYNQASFESGSKAGYQYGGLFGKVDASTASIKNVKIKNSYFIGESAGAIFGHTAYTNGSVKIDNCAVVNCYIESTSNSGIDAGAIGGKCEYNGTENISDKVLVNNCIAYGNAIVNKSGNKRLIGTMEAWHFNGSSKIQSPEHFSIRNTVAIGCAIERADSYWQKNSSLYENCYTTEAHAAENTTITTLTNADEAKGTAAAQKLSGLDKSMWFFNTTGYPELRVFHKIGFKDNADGTHSESCECGLTSGAIEHSFVNGECACGAAAKCGDTVSEYTGTPDTSSKLAGSGTSGDPYIIETADQFAAIALGKKVYAQGSYFKVDPSVDAFYINGGKTVAAMTNAADVKAYFEANGGYSWTSSWDNSTADKSFSGHFDGSGVTIYGLYDADYNSGLFEMAEDSSSFKNFALKNSYIKVGSGAGVAAIVGKVSKQSDPDIMTFENMVVANNYIEQSNAGVGVGASAVLGYLYGSNDGVAINNSIIYGNTIVNPNASATYGLVSVGGNGSAALTQITNVISLGVKPYTAGQGWFLRVLDDNKCFVNVYTDQDCSGMANYSDSNKTKFNFKDSLSLADLQGEVATLTADVLNWNTTWVANLNGLPELRVMHGEQLKISQLEYDGHKEQCSCGLVSPVSDHNYNDSYKCIDCLFVCDHADENHYTYSSNAATDCVTNGTYSKVCECGFKDEGSLDDAAGHNFTDVEENPSKDCLTPGVAAHKHCTECNKNFATDASKNEPMANALSDEQLALPVAEHKASEDENGIIYDMTDTDHSKVCSVCSEKFDTDSHSGDFVPNGATGHTGECTVCGLKLSAESGHTFGDDNSCDDCGWTCENHDFVNGDVITEGDCTTDRVVSTYCSICGTAGENDVTTAPGHIEGDTQIENVVQCPDCVTDGSHDEVVYCTECEKELSRVNVTDVAPGHIAGSSWEENHISDCINGDSYELVTQCSVCFAEASREVVNLEATGHDIVDYEELAPNCVDEGWIAHSQCNNCGEHFAFGTSDKFSEEYINSEDIYIDADPDAHKWVEVVAVDADCENGGTIGYKYCKYCALFVAGETQLEIEIDFDALWEELDPIMTEEYEKTRETFTAAYPEPGEDATDEEWNEFNDAFLEVWNPISESIYDAAYQDAIIEAAKAESVEFETEAKGHTITYVEAVAATYDSEGTKAHYACECGKLYSDAEGKNEITAESLVIEKLVKEDDTTSDKPAGDTSDTSPETDDTIVSLLAFTSLLGAAFIATKKFRNK